MPSASMGCSRRRREITARHSWRRTVASQYFTPNNQEYFQKVAVLIAGGTQGDLVWMSSIEGYYDYASRGTWLATGGIRGRCGRMGGRSCASGSAG